MKVNINIPVHQQATETYKQAIKQLGTHTKLPCCYFQCLTLRELDYLIAEFGEVVEWEVPDYTLKTEAVLTAGKCGTGPKEFNARGLVIDESNKLIYLAGV